MFEDSTFESAGRIRTRSRGWMIAAFTFYTSILLALVLIPLIYPEALPRPAIPFLMEPPTQPPVQQPLPKQTAQTARPLSEMVGPLLIAPPRIPPNIVMVTGPEPAPLTGPASWGPDSSPTGGDLFRKGSGVTVVHPEPRTTLRIPSKVEEGLLIDKRVPIYPAIAREAGVGGTVRLAATISKTGTIENLRVTSGPPLLQQAALDAVKAWRYRPYLLDGQPVEVETTVDVIFTLSR